MDLRGPPFVRFAIYGSSHRQMFFKIGVFKTFAKFTGKHLCHSLFFHKKETLGQVFSCEFWKISKNTSGGCFCLFSDCHTVKSLWAQFDNYLSHDFRLPTLTPQTALFRIFNDSSIAENVSLINHTLLIFKLHIYKSRKNHLLNLHYIIANIRIYLTIAIRNGLLQKINCQDI